MRTSKILSLLVWGTGLSCVMAWYAAVLAGLADPTFSGAWLLVALVALALPTAAAMRPDLWARVLGGPRERVRLPLWMALFSLPLLGAVWGQLCLGSASGGELFHAAGIAGLGGALLVLARPRLVGSRGGEFLRQARFAAVALSVVVAVLAAVVGLRPGPGGNREQALSRYLATLPQPSSFRLDFPEEQGTEGSPEVDVRSHVFPSKEPPVRLLSLGDPGRQAILRYACVGASCWVGASTNGLRGGVLLPAESRIVVREDIARGSFVLSTSAGLFDFFREKELLTPLSLAPLLPHWWLPPAWMLAPFASLLGLAILSWRRQRANEWAEAIEEGEEGDVLGGRLLVDGCDLGPAPGAMREGPVTILGANLDRLAYRSSGHEGVEFVLSGRRGLLAARARASVAALDAWALALTSLTTAPVLGLLLARFF